ncbi:ATP-grasp domain-containing protein [Methylobacillus sp.]|uniref:ATP-grasp domain-containing protein n=1 Tax=Methylobacillus sp. TaxID=56818 RepID=UPI00257C94B4|nr:ATP-grasp domain-containing protein [Methylobacillus sp.]
MRILVLEYITAGGLYREPIPVSLAQEAILMRDAMLDAMDGVPGVNILLAHDPHLPMPTHASQCHVLNDDDEPWQIWMSLMAAADMVWLVAPESAGVLQQLTEAVEASGKVLLTSASEAVRMAGSKWQTYRQLHGAGVPVVETMQAPHRPDSGSAWVVKPDDGVSCDNARYFHDADALESWLQNIPAGHIVQPYVRGLPASLTMLCRGGEAWLLACNQQLVEVEQGRIRYCGGIVNGTAERWTDFDELARQVAAAIPGLFGYVGVDLIIGNDGCLHVLEVNPRLTTSFAGLQAAIHYNPARLLLDLFYNEDFKLPSGLQRNRIEIKLND